MRVVTHQINNSAKHSKNKKQSTHLFSCLHCRQPKGFINKIMHLFLPENPFKSLLHLINRP